MSITYMHVPKTAGTSISEALLTASRPRLPLLGLDRSIFGDFDGFDTIHAQHRSIIRLSPSDLPSDADLIHGHMARSTLRNAYPTHRMLTILREPRTRLISHWLYWRSYADAQLAMWGEWGNRVKTSRKPLLDFLTCPEVACQTDNLMLRMLVWPHHKIPGGAFISPEADKELLQAARDALQSFDFVGAIEEPNLAARLGVFLGRQIRLPRENVTHSLSSDARPELAQELSTSTLAALNARTRLDAILWREVISHCSDDPTQALGDSTFIQTLLNYVRLGIAS